LPELPDIEAYVKALSLRLPGKPCLGLRLASPFLLRTVDPPPEELAGTRIRRLFRLGKRIVTEFDGELFLSLHLMISGRLRWEGPRARVPGRIGLAALDTEEGTLLITEAATKKRASLHLVRGVKGIKALDPGGIEVLEAPLDIFRAHLVRENHTLKRSLTDPRIFSGIGNAYSDEILHHARLSPFRQTRQMDDTEIERLWNSIRTVLESWRDRLVAEAAGEFPRHVTAFREGMSVHGRYRKPCPDCGAPVQRIVYAENESNYCARCQTAGRLLADRSLSRLLKGDWPRTLEELEEGRRRQEPGGSV